MDTARLRFFYEKYIAEESITCAYICLQHDFCEGCPFYYDLQNKRPSSGCIAALNNYKEVRLARELARKFGR